MKNLNLILTTSLIVLMLFSGLNIPFLVSAYTSTSAGNDKFGTASAEYISGFKASLNGPLQYKMLKHSSGKILILTYDTVTNKQMVKTFSSDGALLASTDISSVLGGYPYSGGMSIAEIDSTYAVICISTTQWYFYFIKFNVNSYAFTSTSTNWTGSGAHSTSAISNIILNDGYFYVICSYYAYSDGVFIRVVKCNSAISSASSGSAVSMNSYIMNPYGYLDSVNDVIYWFYSSIGGNAMLCSLQATSGTTLVTLATNPDIDGFPENIQYLAGYGNFYTWNGAGIYYKVTTNDYYLFCSWSFSTVGGPGNFVSVAGQRYTETNFWWMRFDASISSATLGAQENIRENDFDSSLSSAIAPGFDFSYMHSTASSPTIDIWTYYNDITSGPKYVSRTTRTITDITTEPTSFDSETVLRGCDDLDFDFQNADEMLYKDVRYGYEYHQRTDTNNHVVVGGSILDKVYTFTGSVSPADSPYLINTLYTMTFTVYMNGVVDNLNETYKTYINGIQVDSGYISSLGTIVKEYQFGTAKDYLFLINVYDTLGNLQATSQSFTYTMTASSIPGPDDVPDAGGLIGSYAYIFGGYIPIMFVVLGPIMTLGLMGAKMGGAGAVIGMVIGSIVGVVAGVATNILPSYVIYLTAMAVITGLVIFVKMGGGGASN